MEPIETSAARRHLAAGSAALLSAITGIVSYEHGLQVVRWAGNTGLVAFLVPVVPDLMIVTSSLTLMEASAIGARRPWTAMAALAAGIGWTVAMNVAAGWREGPGGALIAGAIPVAFVLTFEAFLWLARRAGRSASVAVLGQRKPPSMDEALALLVEAGSRRAVAQLVGVPKTRVDSWAARLRAVAEEDARKAAEHAAEADASRPGRVRRALRWLHLARRPEAAPDEPPAGAHPSSPDQTAPAGPSLALSNGSHDG